LSATLVGASNELNCDREVGVVFTGMLVIKSPDTLAQYSLVIPPVPEQALGAGAGAVDVVKGKRLAPGITAMADVLGTVQPTAKLSPPVASLCKASI
jgi:hypothetical protein